MIVRFLPHRRALAYGFQDNGLGTLVRAPCDTDGMAVRFIFEDLH